MTVKIFDCASAERLSVLLASDPNAPYRAHRERIGSGRYDSWVAKRGARLLCNASGAFETDSAAIGWNSLAWDSELFGFPAALIEVLAASGGYTEARVAASELLRKVLDEATDAGIRHLIARVASSLTAHAHALAEHGFELIDGIQTFALGLSAASPTGVPGTRLASETDADVVADIARSCFVYDRFHSDVAIGAGTANRVHEEWARNSVSGEAADAVVLATAGNGSIEAFVTIKLDSLSWGSLGVRIAAIPLVASSLEARGKGAARRATAGALAWCRAQQVDLVEVGTQISNIPAARLYQSEGFRTTAVSLTYRRIIE
jgi:dTDP-4-amino-4,6-dideoxy-D-galactose acyltransferase